MARAVVMGRCRVTQFTIGKKDLALSVGLVTSRCFFL